MLLSHMGSATVGTREAMGMLALDGIGGVLRGIVVRNSIGQN